MITEQVLKMALEALKANQPVNYWVNAKGERSEVLTADPFRHERNAKAIEAIEQAMTAELTNAL
jgi:L-2-hydroxyglutarate oxidase LhgO